MIARSGMPAPKNLPGQYRLHADRIADGEIAAPQNSILIELCSDGTTRMLEFGPEMQRQMATSLLLAASQLTNSQAGN